MTGIPATLTAVRRRKLYEDVAGQLESQIHEGRYRPGDQLPSERELMQMFGVGRPAVREALSAMQRMGLVAINSGERARVTRPTPRVMFESLAGPVRQLLAAPEGIRHFQEARTFFEVGLARHAAEHATAAEVNQLREALAANESAIDNIIAFERTDVAFHYVLAVIPRNPIYTAIHEAIAAWLTEQRHVTLQRAGQNEIAYTAHRAVFEAIAARDPDRAEKVMRGHMEQVTKTYWEIKGRTDGGLRSAGRIPAKAGNVRPIPPAHQRKRPRLGS
jgi:GntR family transcriptional regulator, sialic acid-inducible nan operon repressor